MGLGSARRDDASPEAAQLEELVRTYSGFIRRLVSKVGGWRAEPVAEDVEQSVYMGIWQQLRNHREIRHPISYIYRAAVRETLRLLRQRQAHSLDSVGEEKLAAGGGPATAFQGIRATMALEECLANLSSDRRRAVQAHLAGFSVEEIMRMSDWPYQKARNLIARGLADLRAGLRERGVDG